MARIIDRGTLNVSYQIITFLLSIFLSYLQLLRLDLNSEMYENILVDCGPSGRLGTGSLLH